MWQIEYACKELVFHFNKKHLEDDTIPMWVIKFRGETYYVNHVDCSVPWSTKETPDNNHTKGSIKVKNCLVVIDDSNTAIITPLTEENKKTLESKKKFTRIITSYGAKLKAAIDDLGLETGYIKKAGGGCSTLWFITELYNYDEFFQLKFAMTGTDLRVLKENEDYFKAYGSSTDEQEYIDDEEDLYDDEDYESLYETQTTNVAVTRLLPV